VWGDACKPGVNSEESLSLAISGFGGISGGSSSTIPSLLLDRKDNPRLTDLTEPALLPDADLGGVSCYRIDGKDSLDDVQSLWIDKSTLLVRRIEEKRTFPDFRTEETTTYEPEINVAVGAQDLDFNAPGRTETMMQDALYYGRGLYLAVSEGNPGALGAIALLCSVVAGSCLVLAGCIAGVRRIRRRRSPLPDDSQGS
jgi:hypothetical protein